MQSFTLWSPAPFNSLCWNPNTSTKCELLFQFQRLAGPSIFQDRGLYSSSRVRPAYEQKGGRGSKVALNSSVRDSNQKSRGWKPTKSTTRTSGAGGGNELKHEGFRSDTIRLFNVEVPATDDPGKDVISVHAALLTAVATRLGCQEQRLSFGSLKIVRKSFDARKVPIFVYVIDVQLAAARAAGSPRGKLKEVPQRQHLLNEEIQLGGKSSSLVHLLNSSQTEVCESLPSPEESILSNGLDYPRGSPPVAHVSMPDTLSGSGSSRKEERDFTRSVPNGAGSTADTRVGKRVRQQGRIVVVGSGPAGLFAALVLAEAGKEVLLLERGQPVEARGSDIGALIARRHMDPNSNFCYGEGGAGTWSDGKLTTRIGKNSKNVQAVLATLVQFGAPDRILVDGKPHLGTDRLVLILRAFRQHLQHLGVEMQFGTSLEDLEVQAGRLVGVRTIAVPKLGPRGQSRAFAGGAQGLADGDGQNGWVSTSSVVLAVGHSAREVYDMLHSHGVQMSPKSCAVGFRVEHPQELINSIQYGRWSSEVEQGRGKIPVADYSLTADVSVPYCQDGVLTWQEQQHQRMGCYSFCMCPGGQVVPTSTSEWELCVNGMSFSKRNSRWANAALVATVGEREFAPFVPDWGPLAGVAFQRAVEREAALRGGGSFVVPVQRVTDFMEGRSSEGPLPSSSYRLGVRASRLHELYPSHITQALRQSLLVFDRQMQGFISSSALLHGVETRTSSPVRIDRDSATFESVNMKGLYPIGEGAGYAGGIVSAAVDGINAGLAILQQLKAQKPS